MLENVRHVSCINCLTESVSFFSYTISKVYRDILVHIMQMTVIYGMGSLILQVVVKLQSQFDKRQIDLEKTNYSEVFRNLSGVGVW